MPWPGDVCFSIWEEAYASGLLVFPPHGWVLEIGGAESDWTAPLKEERPDLTVLTLDWRIDPRPLADACIRGNVLTFPFAASSFDAIVGISSIEHIGLGHYEHDPLDVDGDRHCMSRVASWLKPGGWFYGDVPYESAGYYVQGTECRVYDDAAVASRLMVPGLVEQRRWVHHGVNQPFQYVALFARKVS